MRDVIQMRTTLNVDDDVLRAVKEIARLRGNTAGAVLSELAREALEKERSGPARAVRNGVPLLPWKAEGAPVDLELVNSLRDELP